MNTKMAEQVHSPNRYPLSLGLLAHPNDLGEKLHVFATLTEDFIWTHDSDREGAEEIFGLRAECWEDLPEESRPDLRE